MLSAISADYLSNHASPDANRLVVLVMRSNCMSRFSRLCVLSISQIRFLIGVAYATTVRVVLYRVTKPAATTGSLSNHRVGQCGASYRANFSTSPGLQGKLFRKSVPRALTSDSSIWTMGKLVSRGNRHWLALSPAFRRLRLNSNVAQCWMNQDGIPI